jgi:hypothetical protein
MWGVKHFLTFGYHSQDPLDQRTLYTSLRVLIVIIEILVNVQQ